MNYIGKTFAIPVWYNAKSIFVPTVDIPRGEWVLLLTMTPIDNAALVIDQDYVLKEIEFNPADDKLGVEVRRLGDQRWQIFFDNRLEVGDSPRSYRYTISIQEPSSTKPPRKFDPMVVAQPDPIYP